MNVLTLRGMERLLTIVVAGLSIYLGYHLFLSVPEQKDSEGTITLSGGTSVYLNRVGPGVFFALFGAFIVWQAISHPISYAENAAPGPATNGKAKASTSTPAATAKHRAPSLVFTGLGSSTPNDGQSVELTRAQLRADISFLNNTLRSKLSEEDLTIFDRMLPQIKLALLRNGWGPDWGSFQDFKNWVDNGSPDDVPDDLKPARDYFQWGYG